jgi:hypothetical protein
MWHSAQSAHTNEQPNCRGQPQNEKSSTGPTARKHCKQSLQVFPLLRGNFTLVRGEFNGIAGPCESLKCGGALDSFGWSIRDLQFDDSALQSCGHRVGSVIDAKLGKDALDVAFDRIL